MKRLPNKPPRPSRQSLGGTAAPGTGLVRLPPVRQNGQELWDYLCEAFPELSRRAVKGLVDSRAVLVNRRRIWMAKHRLQLRDVVELPRTAFKDASRPPKAATPVAVLWEDDALVVADKPPALLTTGAKSLETRLRAQLDLPGLSAVHRLDRDTSGCVCFAKTPEVRAALVNEFAEGGVTKVYRAICLGRLPTPVCDSTRPIDRLPAISHFRTLAVSRQPLCSYLSASIETGRTHQIRIHLRELGCPVAGDRQYFDSRAGRFLDVPRQMLHAHLLRFAHPLDPSQTVEVRSPLPRDFADTLRRFGLHRETARP